ncbi:MAG TPA: DUF1064 domain-containing protein [Micropepsaceae bacterium]|jgi:hypothetical protein|nr:DUF1064 domain-containing protein [Micropepsaceae bacterium]
MSSYRAAGKNKFKSGKMIADGHTFDSEKEHRRYCELKALERAGTIHGLRVHPKFAFAIERRPILIRSDVHPAGRQVIFAPDFQYVRPGFGIVIEDAKSPTTKTQAYKLKKAIFENLYWPAKVEEI